MNYQEAISFIQDSSWMGCKPGLGRITELMDLLGNPQNDLQFIHVAGSNGKGSTSAMLSSILTYAGYRTGLFTSPHLCRYNERIKINNIDISDDELCSVAEKVSVAVKQMHEEPTEFERFTAIALLYFQMCACDIVVLEVGLGGRLDSTNVIKAPVLSVITNIGLEHTELLGDTLEKIAAEKAGIIKSGSDVVLYEQSAEVEKVIRRKCEVFHCGLTVTDHTQEQLEQMDMTGQIFSYRKRKSLRLNLLGTYQFHNAAVVLDAVDALNQRGFSVSEEAVAEGLSRVVWPARMELLGKDPLFLLDGAHNPQCAEALAEALSMLTPEKKAVFITGVLADKDYPAMLAKTIPFAGHCICVTPKSDRALPAEQLSNYLKNQGIDATAAKCIDDAILMALEMAQGEIIVAFGSLYMAGEIRSHYSMILRNWQRKTKIATRRNLLPEERRAFSHIIVEKILHSEAFQNAKYILSYRAMKDEVDLAELDEIARQQGKIISYPRCINKTEMAAMCPKTAVAWRSGRHGIVEPVLEQSVLIPPENLDLVLCPCAAFDVKGRRMGMGAGYYDRYLPNCTHAVIAAVAFENQRLDQAEVKEWDCPMDMVFTEKNLYLPHI